MCCRSKICSVVLAVVALCAVASPAVAQDIVFLKKASGEGEAKRKGEIVEWVGDLISVKGANGVKEFDTDRLIRFETAWHPGYEKGNLLLAAYRYDLAIVQFESALESEPRAWMQNIIFAKLVQCYLATEDFGSAASHFLKVIDDDPQSRFLNLVPLVWTASHPNKQQLKKATQWLESSEPAVALMGASWLLADKTNKKAQLTLEKLSRDFDPVIASLARAQLWRLDTVAVDGKRLVIRIRQVESMPEKVRCGAWYQIAKAQANSNQKDDAIVNFMRIPINDPEQGGLVAASLYQTASLLKTTNREQQSQVLRNELKEKFGDTVWAN